MELVYLYIDNYRNFKEAEFNFGQDVRLHFDNDTKKLTARRCDPALPDGFWGGNIKNLTTLIGNNGSGKTSVFQFIILLLKEMWGELYGTSIQGNGIIAFKENETIFWYANRSFEETGQIRAECDTDLAGRSRAEMYRMRNLISDEVPDIMGKAKFIYLTGSLSREDYQRGMLNGSGRYDHLYDASLGNLISQDMGMDVNRALRLRPLRYPQGKGTAYFSEIETYFAYEQYKQIKYVFDRNQFNIIRKMRQEGYPVPVPDVLHIELRAWSGTDDILCQKKLPQKISFRDMEEAVCGETISHFIESFPRPSVWDEQEKQQYFIGLLRFHLQLSGIICAFRSAARLMDEGDLYIMFRDLPQHLDIREGEEEDFEQLFESLWEAVITSAGERTKAAPGWEALKRCRRCYIDYLEFIKAADLGQHFFAETELSGDIAHDMDEQVLRFYVRTSDAEWFMEFVQKYRYICNPDYFLDFQWGLSSGEYNLLSMFSTLYYIFDADYTNKKNGEYTIWNCGPYGSIRTQKTACDSVVLMIDEADLSYHPEWQRQYISILTAFLPRIYPRECCRDIQVVLSTHSPLLLGDVPQENVIYLSCGGEGDPVCVAKREGCGTFGQNVHLLFKDSFFLENGTIGQFAQSKINGTYRELLDLEREIDRAKQDRQGWAEKRAKLISDLSGRYRKLAEVISEPLIREKMKEKIGSLLRQLDAPVQRPDAAAEGYGRMTEKELRRQLALIEEELGKRSRKREL
ncbi:ATP-binding protein [Lachnoclostridium sp. An76]|uniref:ATP-binding protein n=1 Tax=Lachnoclostridium sp. An76 TaxID=1965654 RepID=UPI000B38749E|nr:ATP-binding protein [Lachnoclostridium sp. An76]OUN34113.1 hypothetical protein B5G27_08530 [Lachnoclostridium sp. An76]